MLVDSGGTGFFPAIGITDGSYNPTSEFQATSTTVVVSSRRRMSIMQAEAFTARLKEVANIFSALFDDKELKSNSGDLLSALRNDLRSAVSAAFDSDYKRLRTDFGVNFDFTQSAKKVFDITFDDRNALVKNLTRDGRPVNKFFFGSNAGTNDGLLEKILNVLKSAESVFKTEFGTIGLFVNKRV